MGLGVDDHADFEHLCGVGISMFCGDEMMILRSVLGGFGNEAHLFPLSSFVFFFLLPLFLFFSTFKRRMIRSTSEGGRRVSRYICICDMSYILPFYV